MNIYKTLHGYGLLQQQNISFLTNISLVMARIKIKLTFKFTCPKFIWFVTKKVDIMYMNIIVFHSLFYYKQFFGQGVSQQKNLKLEFS